MFILVSVVFITLINFCNADYRTVNILLLKDFFVKSTSFKLFDNVKWFHNGVPVNQSSNRHVYFKNGTLKIIQAEVSDCGLYQKCVGTKCSTPIIAEIQDLHRVQKDGITWVFKYDKPNSYTYWEPATEIQCGVNLPESYPHFHVNWSYSSQNGFQVGSSIFLVRNHTITNKSGHTYFYSSLILLQNPRDTVFTCRFFVRTKWGHLLKYEQDFYPNFSGFSLRGSVREYVRYTPKKHKSDFRVHAPAITLSYEKRGGSINATCFSKEGPVQLYIASDVESLNRYNGYWFALTNKLLSLLNFSEAEMNGTYFSSYLFNSSEFISQEVYVVCRCLDKYSFRRLEAQNYSTFSETHPSLLIFFQSLAFTTCFLIVILVFPVTVMWCLKRCRKLRIKRLQRRPSLIYRSIDAVECQQPCPQTHDYVNISITYCPRRIESAESSEDYLEPKRLELKTTSQTRSVRFHLLGESPPTPRYHDSPFLKNWDWRLYITNSRISIDYLIA
ncbi:unnamed protein product [Rodentolepis nana]|uniref:Ig-like domain-containing protein n=1 Tax=Rodentolepis nana TaxID=102285 RepID=A0A0R3T5G2_RODNA|nr:unnamed protein product [Rodentolepis nana]